MQYKQPVARVITRSANVIWAHFGNVVMRLSAASVVVRSHGVRQTWKRKDLVPKRKRTYRLTPRNE